MKSFLLPTEQVIAKKIIDKFLKTLSSEETLNYQIIRRDKLEQEIVSKNFSKIQKFVNEIVSYSHRTNIITSEICHLVIERLQPSKVLTNEEAGQIIDQGILIH